MRPETRRLLERHDDPIGTEVPGNDWRRFPHEQLLANVRAIHQQLLKADPRFDLDDKVQDASFFASLQIHESLMFITFSNFGRLCTVAVGKPEMIAFPLAMISDLLRKSGWIEVPRDDLEEIYDGVNPHLRDGKRTWMNRFFDYL